MIRYTMTAAVQDILTQIDRLDDAGREELRAALRLRARAEWERLAEAERAGPRPTASPRRTSTAPSMTSATARPREAVTWQCPLTSMPVATTELRSSDSTTARR